MRKLLLLLSIGMLYTAQAQMGDINTASKHVINQGYEIQSKGEGWKIYRQEEQYRGWDRKQSYWFNEDGSVWLSKYEVIPTYITKMNGQWANTTFKNFTASIQKEYKKDIKKRLVTWRERFEVEVGDEFIIRETVYTKKDSPNRRIVVRVVRSKDKDKITTGDGNVHYRYRFSIEQFTETREDGNRWALDIVEENNKNGDNPF